MSAPDANDPLIRQLREQISDNDVRIVEALNARLKLVARLKRVKEVYVQFLARNRPMARLAGKFTDRFEGSGLEARAIIDMGEPERVAA
jgi:hypothetical protein